VQAGFCAFCKSPLTGVPEICPDCGNRRFRFLTGRTRFDPGPLSRVEEIGVKDAFTEIQDRIGDDAEDWLFQQEWGRATRQPDRPRAGEMEYVDTRTGQTRWEPYNGIEFKIKQLKDFSGS